MSNTEGPSAEFFISYAIDVKLIRVIGNVLVPSELHLNASVVRSEDAEDYDIELGLTKCKYWFDHIVSKTIAFSRDNTTALDMFLDEESGNRTGNLFMMCPDEPRDETLGALFQAKMNALANGAFFVEAMTIESDNLHGLSFTLDGDHSEFLPKTMEDWLGAPSYFDVPWWHRDDVSTIDVYLSEGTDPSNKPAWAASLDFLDKNRHAKVQDSTVNVVRPEFRPTIIDGGKDDKPE